MRFLSLLLLGLCCVSSQPWSVCEVVLVPYVVGTMTVMRVLLDASMLRELRQCWCGGQGSYACVA